MNRACLLILACLFLFRCGSEGSYVPTSPRNDRVIRGLEGPVRVYTETVRYTDSLAEDFGRQDSHRVIFNADGVALSHRVFTNGKLYQLDSVETNAWGQKSLETISKRRNGRMEVDLRTEFRYRGDGKLEEERRTLEDGALELQRFFDYDERGRTAAIRTNTYPKAANGVARQKRTEFAYRDSSREKTESRIYQDEALVRINFYLQGKKVRQENYSPVEPGRMTGWTVYEYDVQGDFQRERSYDGRGNLLWRELRLYDSEGKEFEVFRENGAGEMMVHTVRDFNAENDPVYRAVQVFDANYRDGRTLVMDTTPDTTRYAYRYDARGNWVYQRIDRPEPGRFEVVTRSFTYFPDSLPGGD